MLSFYNENVIDIYHWSKNIFSFKTTRNPCFRFRNGEFTMIGLCNSGNSIFRAYSIASANYEENLEFISIKVDSGDFTSILKKIRIGDPIMVSKKSVGNLIIDDLLPGNNLYLLCSGTGIAPFLSVIKDPDTYERFQKIILIHSVTHESDLVYHDFIKNILPNSEFIGNVVSKKLIYYPNVTRDKYGNKLVRVTSLISNEKFFFSIGMEFINVYKDRFMLCGSLSFINDICNILNQLGFIVSKNLGFPGHYVIERAFIER